ncbi:hypothetical protein PoB_005482400 [Plakobranchus ocellatus]|uniref:Uncharacterized protein n=1 Tax=Plakobranchus ocellatus TaxID=259542 RepID=A0AAV4CC87_9GAST|nr:hypothetical protein PoB_005482400 [Plakobranchus ocellatus]
MALTEILDIVVTMLIDKLPQPRQCPARLSHTGSAAIPVSSTSVSYMLRSHTSVQHPVSYRPRSHISI